MVPEKGWGSKDESINFGPECQTQHSEAEEAVTVIQTAERGVSMCWSLRHPAGILTSDHCSAPYKLGNLGQVSFLISLDSSPLPGL